VSLEVAPRVRIDADADRSPLTSAKFDIRAMADSDKERTLTAEGLADVGLPQPPPPRLVAPLQYRDPHRYEVLGEHGRGGLGVVSRAHDRELGRDVAIKEILSRDDVAELRFLREALITARLEHPGIVPVHEAGRWPNGMPFYVMKLVAGRSLKELLAERPTIEARLELLHHVIAVADAVAYAHKRKIIHRDLKAANVIAGDFGETVVIDWGLAKDLSAADTAGSAQAPFRTAPADDLTAADGPVGTPMYMSPEQSRSESVDQRTDVYAIGIMLWQLCSLAKVPPTEPRERTRELRRAGIDKDLIAIIGKALVADPAGRYRDAGELAADLKAFKAGVRIAARRYSVPAVLTHWIRRHRALAATVATAAVIAIAGSIVFVANIAAERDRADAALTVSEQQQRRAEQEQQRAEQANDELVLHNAALLMHRDPTAVVEALAGYRGRNEVRRQMLLAEARGRGVARATFAPHTKTIWFLAGTSDGAIVSLSQDRRIRVTRGATSTTLAADLRPTGPYAYAQARGLLAYARVPIGISVIDLKTQAITPVADVTPTEMAITPDGSRLAVVDAHGLTVWALSPQLAATKLFDSPHHGAAVSFAGPSHVILWDQATLRSISLADGASPPPHTFPSLTSLNVRNVDIALGNVLGQVTLLSRDLAPIATIKACQRRVNSVRFADRADIIAFTCQDNTAGVIGYDVSRKAMSLVETFPTHEAALEAEPDAHGTRVVVMTDSNIVYSHDLQRHLTTRQEGHVGRVSAIAAPTTDYEGILVGGVNGTVRVWDVPSHAARVLLRTGSAVFGAAFSSDDRSIITAGKDGVIHHIATADGSAAELRGHEGAILKTAAAPDGRSLLSYGIDGTVRTWEPTSHVPLRVFTEHGNVGEAEYIEGGRLIVSVGDDGRLLVWSSRGTDVELRFTHPDRLPLRKLVVLDRPGHYRFIVSDLNGAIWSVARDGEAHQLRKADGRTTTVLRASLDGTLLAVGSSTDSGTGTVTIYRTSDDRVMHETSLSAGIRQIRFDPQNRDLLIVSEDGGVRALPLSAHSRFPWATLSISARNADYSSNGQDIAIVCVDGGTWFHSLPGGRWVYARDHATDIFSGGFSHTGADFVSTDLSGAVVIRSIQQTF
jgi:WD40 repeat protein